MNSIMLLCLAAVVSLAIVVTLVLMRKRPESADQKTKQP
jgi:hypothetical protein